MEDSEKKQITIGFGRDKSKNSMIFIQDTGMGIELDHIKHIFDPFYTTKPQGSGLGLAIAQRLSNQNNSWIEIKKIGKVQEQLQRYIVSVKLINPNLSKPGLSPESKNNGG